MTSDPIRSGPSKSPWVDVHAHPGRCFLGGLGEDDRLASALGGDSSDQAVAEIIDAGMAAVSFATVADLRVIGPRPDGGLHAVRDFKPGEAVADHRRQLDALQALVARHDLPIVRVADDVLSAHRAGRTALFVTCEGADFVEDRLERVGEAHAAGVRSITLVHYRQSDVGDLQTEPPLHGGLSSAGRELVREMDRLGMLIDVAHASYETTLGVLEESTRPIILSHTHLDGGRRDNPRLVSREHAQAVAAAGGLVGAWPSGVCSETFDDFIDEIARLAEVIGVDHVGIGTDMDANYKPVMSGYSEFASIGASLAERGFTTSEVDGILGGNAINLIRAVCG